MSNKIKRGKDLIDFENYSSASKLGWDNYITDYNFGKKFDFDKMLQKRDIALNALMDGTLTFNASDNNRYMFDLNTQIPELMDKSKETEYALGYLGQKLLEAQKAEPWNSTEYHNNIIKNSYFKGQDPNYELLKNLTPDQKTTAYNEMLDYFINSIDNIPEDQREDYLQFYNLAKGYMSDKKLLADEILNLSRYTGSSWDWLQESEVKKEPTVEVEKPSDQEGPDIEKPTPKPEEQKPIQYEDYYTPNFGNFSEEQYKYVLAMDDKLFDQGFTRALNNPDKFSELLPYMLMAKTKKSKIDKNGMVNLNKSSKNYDFFFDINNKKILKRKKSNYAKHKNVTTNGNS